jgi:hypothetical protein
MFRTVGSQATVDITWHVGPTFDLVHTRAPAVEQTVLLVNGICCVPGEHTHPIVQLSQHQSMLRYTTRASVDCFPVLWQLFCESCCRWHNGPRNATLTAGHSTSRLTERSVSYSLQLSKNLNTLLYLGRLDLELGYRLCGRGSIAGSARGFSLTHSVQTGCGTHWNPRSLLSNGHRVKWPELEANHLRLVPWLRMTQLFLYLQSHILLHGIVVNWPQGKLYLGLALPHS